ncbi:MAG: type II secretion system protein [Deltaproteobacteria bacterium]|nr:type II secretion system protein [Deltaproteobacteria bacterium]
MGNCKGFTLLETLIAMSIMLVAFAAILMVESSSLNTSLKTKQLNIVSMLAKRAMIEAEQTFEGKSFEEIRKEETFELSEPYKDYKVLRSIKEIKFPDLSFGGGESSKGDKESGTNDMTERVAKLMAKYLSQAIREVTVTVVWKKGSGEQSYSVSTYWVDLNHEFQIEE